MVNSVVSSVLVWIGCMFYLLARHELQQLIAVGFESGRTVTEFEKAVRTPPFSLNV